MKHNKYKKYTIIAEGLVMYFGFLAMILSIAYNLFIN
jgi:hypothetical protein